MIRLKPLSLTGRLALVISAVFLFGSFLPVEAVRFLFTISDLLKTVLEFFLPAIVFFFIADGIISFGAGSLALVIITVGSIFASNFLTSLYSYGVSTRMLGYLSSQKFTALESGEQLIAPYITFNLPVYLKSEHAMLGALVTGLVLSLGVLKPVKNFMVSGRRMIEWGLSSLFIPLLPFYVAGFFLKLGHENSLMQLGSLYGVIFICGIAMQVIYLCISYLVVSGFSIERARQRFMIALPSYLTALGTMSSIATLPVSVESAVKNTNDRALSQFAMPIGANIHLMGDSVIVPLFSIVTMQAFLGIVPDFFTFLSFVLYFCLTMLAVSGIPGGGIIVMLPLLKSMFGFTPEMLSVMTALYLLQDGFGTAANVMGDGALVIFLKNITNMLGLTKTNKKETVSV